MIVVSEVLFSGCPSLSTCLSMSGYKKFVITVSYKPIDEISSNFS